MGLRELLEKGYEIASWKDDPWSPEGQERYRAALRKLATLLEHPWMAEATSESMVSVLDLGAGRGIGGVALARLLKEQGVNVRLVMVDLRECVVSDGLRFAREEGVEAEAYQMDALEAYRLGRFDVVLMYGAMFPHFDSWNMCRLLASAAEAMKDEGVVVVEELDRVDMIFRTGFREVILENPNPEELSISVHVGYDVVRGAYKRCFMRLRDLEHVEMPLSFRSVSAIAATLWLFTEDVDLILAGERWAYFILGRRPRRLIRPERLAGDPAVLERGRPWTK